MIEFSLRGSGGPLRAATHAAARTQAPPARWRTTLRIPPCSGSGRSSLDLCSWPSPSLGRTRIPPDTLISARSDGRMPTEGIGATRRTRQSTFCACEIPTRPRVSAVQHQADADLDDVPATVSKDDFQAAARRPPQPPQPRIAPACRVEGRTPRRLPFGRSSSRVRTGRPRRMELRGLALPRYQRQNHLRQYQPPRRPDTPSAPT